MIELKSILKKTERVELLEKEEIKPRSLEDRVCTIYSDAVQSALFSICLFLDAPKFSTVSFSKEKQVHLVPSREELDECGLLPDLYDFSIKNIKKTSGK